RRGLRIHRHADCHLRRADGRRRAVRPAPQSHLRPAMPPTTPRHAPPPPPPPPPASPATAALRTTAQRKAPRT
ncbi:conserved hypothetical protein, partial [Ricinus communis]